MTDSIKNLMSNSVEVQRTHVQAALVDRTALAAFQEANDPLQAAQALKLPFRADLRENGGDAVGPPASEEITAAVRGAKAALFTSDGGGPGE